MRRGSAVLFLLLGALVGARLGLAYLAPLPMPVEPGHTATLEGTVADDVDVRANAVRVTLEIARVDGTPARGRALVVLSAGTALEYGDRVVVRGRVELPQAFETQGGRTFDYPGYLHARGIGALMRFATLEARSPGASGVLRTLFAVKHRFEHALERVLRAPASALMEGFLLGEKAGLPQALAQAFVLAGLIHVVVLSGYNIGVVSEWTLRLFAAVLPRRAALCLTGVTIVLFALMAGGGMATMRAAVMGLIAILARYLGRPAAALRSLAAAAVGMLLWNPLSVLDPGFVLSILATFGLITLAPWVEQQLSLVPFRGVRSVAATTIAVQLFVLPALLYYTGVLSFVSVPANVLVLPFIPLAMLLGFLAGVLALVYAPLALVPALAAQALLGAMIWVTEKAATLPLAAYMVPAFPLWVAIAAYLPLLFIATRLHASVAASSIVRRIAPLSRPN